MVDRIAGNASEDLWAAIDTRLARLEERMAGAATEDHVRTLDALYSTTTH